jgi:hypothetical protein
MMRAIRNFICLAAALPALLALPAQAQTYQPDVLEIDGESFIAFEPSEAYTIADGGTLEFWAVPDWTEDPEFDPVMIANVGPEGASYIIAITAERDGILITSGENEVFFNFDFTDGKMHHIALNQFTDGIIVAIDGVAIGESDMMLQDFSSSGLIIGSLEDESDPFLGAIAAIRFWDYVPKLETLIAYAQRDILLSEHPSIEQLSAMSDFNAGTMEILEEIEQ